MENPNYISIDDEFLEPSMAYAERPTIIQIACNPGVQELIIKSSTENNVINSPVVGSASSDKTTYEYLDGAALAYLLLKHLTLPTLRGMHAILHNALPEILAATHLVEDTPPKTKRKKKKETPNDLSDPKE